MREKLLKRSLLALILVILIVPLTSVEAQDFTITKDTSSLSVCPGSTLLIETIVNSANGGSEAFTVSQDRGASRFSISVPTGFILSPGERRIVFSYVTPPSVTRAGTYNLRISVSSSGVVKNVEYSIVVEDCRAVSLQLQAAQEICPGEAATYSATIRNDGIFTEDYVIGVEGPATPWVILSDSFVRLDSGQQKELFVFITAPVDRTGDFDFTLTASSASRAFASASSALRVLPCYNYDLTSEMALYQLCEADTLAVPLVLENKGTVSNTYSLSLDTSFVVLEQDAVTLLPGQQTVVNLIVNPPYGTEGDFPINVNIESERGQIRKILPLTIRVDNCYDIQTEIPVEALGVCNGFTTQEEVLVQNTGRFENTFTLSLEGADFVTLDRNTLTLKPGTQESVLLTIAPPEGIPARTYNIRVTATDPVSLASSTDDIRIATISRETCFFPSITSAQRSIKVSKDSAAAVSFTIENTGLKEASYVLELSGNALSFAQVNPSVLILKPSESESVFLHLAPSLAIAEGDYIITLVARVEDSQISSSETLAIEILPQGEVPEILPGAVVERTPLQAIRDFFRRLFSVEVIKEEVPEEVEEIDEEEEAEEEGEEAETEEKVEEMGEEEVEEKVEEGEEGEVVSEEVTAGETPSVFDRINALLDRLRTSGVAEEPEITEEPEEQMEEEGDEEEVGEEEEIPVERKSFLDRLRDFFNQPAVEEEAEEVEEGEKEEAEEPEVEEGEEEVEDEEKEDEEMEEDEELISKVEEEGTSLITGQSARTFLSNYAYHLVAAMILIVIIIIVATGYWKKIADFFVEEEETNTRTRKSNKKARIRR